MKDIPVIKSSIHNGKYFIYTPYTNNIINITKMQFEEVKKLERIGITNYIGENNESESRNDIIKLINSKFITGTFINNIKHPVIDNYAVIINRRINCIVLQVTQRCNFSCRYCHDAQPGSASTVDGKTDMSWVLAKQSVDFLITHSQDSDLINFYFYGGEPLLNFKLIQKVVDYINFRINTKTIIYRITTNLSLMTEEIAEYFYLHNFKIAISLDGAPDIQNCHRKFINGDDTFDIVWNNVKMLRNIYGARFYDDIVFLPVIFADENKTKVIDFFVSNDIHLEQLFFQNANTSGIEYTEGSIEFRNQNYNNSFVMDTEDETNLLDEFNEHYNDKRAIRDNWHHAGPCVVGAHKLFVNVKGEFYPCEKISHYPSTSFGNISTGIDIERAKKLINIGKLTENECINCWCIRFCKICLMNCVDEESCCISKEIKLLHCNAQKKRVLYSMFKYIDDINSTRNENEK